MSDQRAARSVESAAATAAAAAGAAGAARAAASDAADVPDTAEGPVTADGGMVATATAAPTDRSPRTDPAGDDGQAESGHHHHDREREHREKRIRGFIEIAATLLLGLAAVFTAWSAYQSVVHSGASLEGFTQSSLKSVEAQKNGASGDLYWTEDMIIWVEYQKALRGGDTAFAEQLKALMSPNLIEGMAWWEAQPSPRPASPFVEDSPEWMNEYYDRQVVLEKEAADAFAQAQNDGAVGDQFTLATVLYAVVLFFAGIATAVRRPLIAGSALAFGAFVFVVATVHLAATQLAV